MAEKSHPTPPKKLLQVRPGDLVKVHQRIVEGGKERTQLFEGVVIKVARPKSQHGSFTVRKVSFGVGVERVYPFISSAVKRIELIKSSKVRRARLYYLRHLAGKSARLRERKRDPLTRQLLLEGADETTPS